MSFMSSEELALMANPEDNTFPLEFVVRVVTETSGLDVPADSVEHALDIQGEWLKKSQTEFCEIFRVNSDGSLKKTIGAVSNRIPTKEF